MTQRQRSVDLVVPGLLGPVPESVARSPAAGERFPALLQLLSRGYRHRHPETDPAAILAERFGMHRDALAAGPVGLLGVGEEPGDRFWFRVDPVHLRPDRDRLVVFGPAAVEITPTETAGIAEACNSLLEADGMHLVPARDHWYLGMTGEPDVRMASIYSASGHYMDAYLPAGPDARRWNALLSELQMLLHGLPLNQQRESENRPTINGLWPWGGGHRPAACDGPFATVFADDALGRGMARLAGAEAAPLPQRTSQLSFQEPVLLYDTRALEALTSGDASAWLEAVNHMDNDRFADLLGALRGGALKQLRIWTGGGWSWSVTPWALRRLWRRVRGFRHWLELVGSAGR